MSSAGRDRSAPSIRVMTLARPGSDSIGGLQTDLLELAGDVLRRRPLPHGRPVVAGIGRVDVDQLGAQLDDLVLGV